MKILKKFKSWVVKAITGLSPDAIKYTKRVFRQHGRTMILEDQFSGMEDNYLFDFLNYSGQYTDAGGGGFIGVAVGGVSEGQKQPPQKIVVRPKQVVDELETVPTPFSIALIDEKISILRDKEKLIVQHYAKRELTALIERLENRKKYGEHREFFDSFQNTTDEKISALTDKYALVMKTSDIFVPEFPDEAVKVMKDYTEKMDALCGKKPIFYVIAPEKDFRKAFEKRDPILLVQSPFGFYWQILGVWDEEMLILSEL